MNISQLYPALAASLLATSTALGQGSFTYDQQSFTTNIPRNIEYQVLPGTGQSFVPNLGAIGFVKLELDDGSYGNGLGATVYVNLRSDAINGPLVSSTDPVFMPDRFFGETTFLFSAAVSLVPGVTYFLEPIVQSGDAWYVNTDVGPNYPQGTMYKQGAPQLNSYFWFREGVVTPEPKPVWLVLLGAGFLVYADRKRPRHIARTS